MIDFIQIGIAGKKEGRKEGREGGREEGRKGGREEGRKGGKNIKENHINMSLYLCNSKSGYH